MMKILVTGGAGAIGSNLVRRLVGEVDVHGVDVLDDLSSGYRENLPDDPKIRFVQGSITDDALLTRLFQEGAYDVVVHFAANFANQSSVEHPRKDLEVNGMGTLKLFEHANKHRVRRLVYSSSSCVYGHKDGILRESDQSFCAETPYAATKLLGERYAQFFHHFHGLDVVTLRFFNSYGPGERPGRYRNVIPNFFSLALQGQPLPITGDGTETRDFNFVGDAVDGTVRAIRTPGIGGKVFNIASGRETPILKIAEWINRVTGNTAGIRFQPRRKWDGVLRRVGSVEEAERHLGYHSSTPLEEGIRRTHEWFLTHQALLLDRV